MARLVVSMIQKREIRDGKSSVGGSPFVCLLCLVPYPQRSNGKESL